MLLVNALRGEPLVRHEVLDTRAQIRADFLCENNQWSHDGWLDSFNGIEYGEAGENLAMGFDQEFPMVFAWMNSRLHHNNIVNPVYKYTGIAEGECGKVVHLFSERI